MSALWTKRSHLSGQVGLGFFRLDQGYLSQIATVYQGGPVGIETLAAALSEQRDTLEEVVEPYLLQQGFLQRTPRGF